MALINRVSRLFRADFNAVLDQIEEPEQLLRQAIRDMEEELGACQRRIDACAQEQEGLQARGEEVRASLSEYDRQLDLCFESGKDELARGIVRRKLESGRLLQRLDSRREANSRYLERQRKLLEENRTSLEDLRQKAELIVADGPGGGTPGVLGDFSRNSREWCVAEDEVEVAFLREMAARSRS